MKKKDLLIHRLRAYGNSDMYPFHMPGHKRREMEEFSYLYQLDITEIEGFDSLHYPDGILKESMEWAAGVYGADRTHYLVNGSSCGLLAAICGSVPRGGRILVSRNCHKSVYNGIFLQQLRASYVYPQEVLGMGIQGGIRKEDVEEALARHMDIQAVLIVSPTYEGVVSDIKEIAKVVHRAGLPLIVDEAHGAHFRFGESFPVSALDLGADVVIQSVHKTLPCLTQTALIHMKGNRPGGGSYVDMDRIERYLHIYQSTSPSYLLIASIENGIFHMEGMDLNLFLKALKGLRKRLGNMRHLRLITEEIKGQFGVFDLDFTKLVVSTGVTGATGGWLEEQLRDRYHLEMEMCSPDYVVAITAAMDWEEGLKRLGDALTQIDGELGLRKKEAKEVILSKESTCIYSRPNHIAMTIFEAMDGSQNSVVLKESSGFVSGEFVYIYPPGIPILAPGERISQRTLNVILSCIDKKLPVKGLSDKSLQTIRVVDEN